MAVHSGSWFGLPDFGITEAIGNAFGAPQSAQGGSNVLGANTQNRAQSPVNNSSPQFATTVNYPGGDSTNVSVPPRAAGVNGGSVTSSGGGSSQLQQLQAIGGNRNPHQESEYQRLLNEMNQGQNQTNALIDEAYGQSNNYLNQAENALKNDYPTILQEIEAQKAGALRTAQTGFDTTMGTVKTNEESATMRNQNVMADARRLYDELRRGYGQRFGGASSAGQAATELGNLEQQRQAGRQQQDFQTTMKEIEGKRTEINQKFEDQKFQLEQVTNQAKNEANRDFQNKLLQISQSRAENEQAKAQARLSALQDLRNKVYQIQLQNLQFNQTLQAQKQQAESSLGSFNTNLGTLASDTGAVAQGFNPTATSNLQVDTSRGFSATPEQYQGITSTLPTNRKNELFPGLTFGN